MILTQAKIHKCYAHTTDPPEHSDVFQPGTRAMAPTFCCSGLFWALKIGLTIQLPITRCHGRARHIQVHVKKPVGTSHEYRIICITVASTQKTDKSDKSFSTIVGFDFSFFRKKLFIGFCVSPTHHHHRFFPPCPEWLG